jgi:hypothetical protein
MGGWRTRYIPTDMPASMQMTESPKNTNTMNSEMRVEGRVTCPSKSTLLNIECDDGER